MDAIDSFLSICKKESEEKPGEEKKWYGLIIDTKDIQYLGDYFGEDNKPIMIGGKPTEKNTDIGDFQYELNRIKEICKLINDRTKIIENCKEVKELINTFTKEERCPQN